MLHIDTNLVNARQKLDDVNQLERWCADGVVLINMSGTARGEAIADGDPRRTWKADQQIFTMTAPGDRADPTYTIIENALFLDGVKNNNQRNDVRIVFEAAKYGAVLVTGDGGSKTQPGGMLGNRDKLKHLVRIVSPAEAVALVRDKIRERDEFNARVAREYGQELPAWTGAD